MLFRSLLVAGLLASSAAQSREMFSYLTISQDPAGADLTFSPCQEDELAECVAHVLTCRKSESWSDVEFTIIYGDVEKIVAALIVGTAGTATADLILKG